MKITKLIIWTVALNFFILIGIAHGIAPIGLIEIGWFPYLNSKEFHWSITSSYDNSICAIAFLNFLGQIILITSLILKNLKAQAIVIYSGFIVSWIGFVYLTHTLFINSAARISFITGILFLIISIMLFFRVRRAK